MYINKKFLLSINYKLNIKVRGTSKFTYSFFGGNNDKTNSSLFACNLKGVDPVIRSWRDFIDFSFNLLVPFNFVKLKYHCLINHDSSVQNVYLRDRWSSFEVFTMFIIKKF